MLRSAIGAYRSGAQVNFTSFVSGEDDPIARSVGVWEASANLCEPRRTSANRCDPLLTSVHSLREQVHRLELYNARLDRNCFELDEDGRNLAAAIACRLMGF